MTLLLPGVVLLQASGGSPSPLGGISMLVPMAMIFLIFYFLLIRPQQKKAKDTRAMLDALEKGNEVVTAGGIVGRITKLTDQYASLEVAPNVEMTVQRGAIAQLLPKGTIKAI